MTMEERSFEERFGVETGRTMARRDPEWLWDTGGEPEPAEVDPMIASLERLKAFVDDACATLEDLSEEAELPESYYYCDYVLKGYDDG